MRLRRSASAPGAVRVRTFHALGLRDPARRRAAGRAARRSDAVLRRGRAGRRAAPAGGASTPRSRGSSSTSASTADGGRGRPRGRARRAGLRGLRGGARRARRARLRRPGRARAATARGTTGLLAPLARGVRPPARRRGPGRRPGPAPPGAAPRRPGEPDLPRRRRRPVDLRLAARRRPAGPGARRRRCRACGVSTSRSNYRCPGPVVERAVRLVEHNARAVRQGDPARPGATGTARPRARRADEPARIARSLRAWPDDDGTRAILARTNRELLPAVVVALDSASRFGAARGAARRVDPRRRPARARPRARDDGDAAARSRSARSGQSPAESRGDAPTTRADEIARALLGWAARTRAVPAFVEADRRARARLAELRRDDAPLTLATAHATKGLEFDHVAVIGMDVGRFPARAPSPTRRIPTAR